MQPAPSSLPEFKLTDAQFKVLTCLIGGSSASEAARAAGVHRNTITNWRNSVPAFSIFLNQAYKERELHFDEQAKALQGKALRALEEVLQDPAASPSARVRAALGVFKIKVTSAPESPAQPDTRLETEAVEPETSPQTAKSPAPKIENLHKPAQQPVRLAPQPGRNTQCPCGSGVKYKRCCALKAPETAAIPIAA
jgi:hypothetical protein